MANNGPNDQQLQLLSSRFKSKHDLYTYMDRVMQIFLPRERQCSLIHMQDLLANRKRFYNKGEVRSLKMPVSNNHWLWLISLCPVGMARTFSGEAVGGSYQVAGLHWLDAQRLGRRTRSKEKTRTILLLLHLDYPGTFLLWGAGERL